MGWFGVWGITSGGWLRNKLDDLQSIKNDEMGKDEA